MTHVTPHARVPVTIARNAALTPQARCLYMILASYTGAEYFGLYKPTKPQPQRTSTRRPRRRKRGLDLDGYPG